MAFVFASHVVGCRLSVAGTSLRRITNNRQLTTGNLIDMNEAPTRH